MHRYVWIAGLAALFAAGCSRSVNVQQERDALMAADREWSQTTKDPDKFLTYFSPEATLYPPGMPMTTGSAAIRKTGTEMFSAPGMSLQWTPAKADVSASGDLGLTAGTYEVTMGGMAEKGKYVSVWRKQTDGSWKVTEDIFNADTAGPPP